QLNNGPWRNDGALRNDDDSSADEPVVSVRVFHVCVIHEPRTIAYTCVLVDDRPTQNHVAPDAERWAAVPRFALFIEVGPEQHRAADLGSGGDMRTNSHDALVDVAAIEKAPFGDD